MTTGLVDDDAFLLHRAPYDHPEHPGRLSAIRERLAREGLTPRFRRVEAREATREELLAVHTGEHLDRVAGTARVPFAQLDPDTYTCSDSARAARLAAGGLVDLTRDVVSGALANGLALLRPPGHHAEADRAMGFCLFNNVAVATRAARDAGVARVLVVDWDLHHGNGTQHSFEEDPDVLYFSTHQFPFYPGTGAIDELGRVAGRGRTVNVPWPAGMGDAEYVAAFDRVLLPIARAFDPQLVLVSCGFDAAAGDLLGGMRLSADGYAAMTERVRSLAGGRVVLALEGGYNLEALGAAAAACARVLLGDTAPARDFGPPNAVGERVLRQVVETHRP
ncbi:MAG TPA: histone deacetylase, partial [Thermoanaerobaculia bacterium]|nr:histone deacetylase [Thermoanaerobaculia bacterium]